ncbi:protein CNPPD1 [Cimex lectularius]|uniref:Protein CNPPD1 n=1 Tax=Cimex lectularius TaxID=79782 RepID=A0A8I6TKX9_CIMLE|nr:protein CNPPD1 [Cimex lectularius]XP_024084951.1 protein CNPPD1 [Cimex lectularius]
MRFFSRKRVDIITRLKVKPISCERADSEFLKRIKKTLYFDNEHLVDNFSLPVSELAIELYSEVKKSSISMERLNLLDVDDICCSTGVSPCAFILAMIYLEKLKACNSSYIEKTPPPDLFLVLLLVATKFLFESGRLILNCHWAERVGLSLKAVNDLEKQFLNAINWEVFVQKSVFHDMLRTIEKTVAMKEGKKRGWFSYTDLELLIDSIDTLSLAQTFFTVLVVCSASYAAGMFAVVGSMMLVTQIPPNIAFYSNAIFNLNVQPNMTVLEKVPVFVSETLTRNDINDSYEDFICDSLDFQARLSSDAVMENNVNGPYRCFACNSLECQANVTPEPVVINNFNGSYKDFICDSLDCNNLQDVFMSEISTNDSETHIDENGFSNEFSKLFLRIRDDFLSPLPLHYFNYLPTMTKRLTTLHWLG